MLLPTIVLVAIGLLFAPPVPDPELGGQRYHRPLRAVDDRAEPRDPWPQHAARSAWRQYRERGVLRRLSTTPASPAALLVAQLVINAVVAFAAVVLLIVVGNVAFGIPLPKEPLGFLVAFALGMSSLFALGLLVAAHRADDRRRPPRCSCRCSWP